MPHLNDLWNRKEDFATQWWTLQSLGLNAACCSPRIFESQGVL
jgi:hypothetical protein